MKTMDILVDWCSLTLMPKGEDCGDLLLFFKSELFSFFHLDDEFSNFIMLRGVNGYYKRYTYNGVMIQTPTIERMGEIGVNIVFTGEGCRFVENLSGWREDGGFSWSLFFQRIFSLQDRFKVNICRIDTAVDDKAEDDSSGILNLDTIQEYGFRGDFISKSRGCNRVSTSEGLKKCNVIHDGEGNAVAYRHMEPQGKTLYFGRRISNTFIRIYDKAAEQKVSGHWVRFEMVLKQKNAMFMAKHIVSEGENFGRFFASFIYRYLRFVNWDDSNITRCSITEWWAAFLGEVDKLKLVLGEIESKTIEKMVDVFTRSWSTNMYCVLKTMGVRFVIDNIIAAGAPRLSKRHRDAIDSYYSVNGGDSYDAEGGCIEPVLSGC